VTNAGWVGHACEEIDFIASLGLPYEVSTNTMYLRCVKTMMENASKPDFFRAAGVGDLALIIEMAEAVASGEEPLRDKPFLIHYSEPTAPLRHSRGALDKLLLCAEKEVPIFLHAGGHAGRQRAGAAGRRENHRRARYEGNDVIGQGPQLRCVSDVQPARPGAHEDLDGSRARP
jgi:trimethylamine:corrinoid methyltransferase-like protein